MNAESKTFRRSAGLVGFLPMLALVGLCLMAVGCRQDMQDQKRFEPYEANPFFENGMASRAPLPQAVAREQLREDTVLYTGLTEDMQPSPTFPFEVDQTVLYRGQRKFEQICSPCHDRVGSGNGMIVQRGYKQPTSFHDDRLRAAMPGYFVNVMSEGFGQMGSYAHIVTARDRWAIAAYIQALQLSQSARASELTAGDLDTLSNQDAAGHGTTDHDGAHSSGAK